ncbi:MAG: hypothetical protein H8E05_00050 [Bacteroidetes bacterium]|nr:hypothetical protein [Bacteroidota bacterium]
MPVSKHRKKNSTAREWRKKRNIRIADARAAVKTQKLGYMRMQRMFNEELAKEIIENEQSDSK